MELAHANRVATMGQLTASIVHEVNQPITATMTNAQAALRFLDAQVVDLNEVRQILNDIVKDGDRAGEVISRIRDLIKKAPPRREGCEISGAIREVIELSHESSSHVISDLYRSPILDLRALDAEEPRYAWTGRSCQAISHHGGRAKRNVKGGTAATLLVGVSGIVQATVASVENSEMRG